MKKLTDVIRRPLITEKTTVIRDDGRTLVFQVARDANKIDIKRAVADTRRLVLTRAALEKLQEALG